MVLDRELADIRSIAITSNNIGEVMRVRGDLVRARELFTEGLHFFEELEFKLGVAAGLSNLADVHMRLGDDRQAATYLMRAIAVALELKHPAITIEALEVSASLAVRRQEPQQAVRLFGAADALREEAGIPRSPAEQAIRNPWIEMTRTMLSGAEWTAIWEEGRAIPIEQACEEAATTARLHATAPALEARTGQTAALTRREQEIARLVAAGLTNQQIAAQLSIATRTTDTHVSNILRKLGLSSRAEVSDWVSSHSTGKH